MRAGEINAVRAIYAKVWEQQRRDLPLICLWNAKNIVGMKRTLNGFRQAPDALTRVSGMSFARG